MEHRQRLDSKRISNRLVELQIFNRRGKIELPDSTVLEGIILIRRGDRRARLHRTLEPHLEKPRVSILCFQMFLIPIDASCDSRVI